MRVVLLIILSIVYFQCHAQKISHDAFLQQQRNIDSLIRAIETNQKLIEKQIIGGDSIYGQYNGRYLYDPQSKSVEKIECTFLSDPTKENYSYFYKDSLVKMRYKQTIVYCIGNTLVDELGMEINATEGMSLLLFQNRTRRLLRILMED
jgi:hypothetical protein